MSSFQQFLQQWSPAIFCGLIVLLNLSYIHTSQLMMNRPGICGGSNL